jgi:glycosyltransferase involved in cell wall biosynthesis
VRIHIVSLVFPPERGSARRVGELALSLANKGHSVSVVTSFPSYPKGIVFDGYKKSLLHKERWEGKIDVYRVFTHTSRNRQRTSHRVRNYLSFAIFSFLGLMAGPKPDIVYATGASDLLGLTSWLAATLRGAKLALDIQDLWPDAPIALGYVKSSWLIAMLRWIERFAYSRASLVLTISQTMKERVSDRVKEISKVVLVQNWVDLNQYCTTDGHALRTRLGFQGKFIVLFAGNIGKAQNLQILLDAAVHLRGHTEVQCVILGDGVEKSRLIQRANQLSLKNLSFLDSVEENHVPEFLGMADVLLVTLGRAKHREAAIPSKLQVYMASAKPIIVAAEGATAEVVESAGCGLVVAPDDGKALAESMCVMKRMSESGRDHLGQAGRMYAVEHFSMGQQCSKIESHLTKLLDCGGYAIPA